MRHAAVVAIAGLAALFGAAGCLGQKVPEKTRYVLKLERPEPREPLGAGTVRMARIRVAPLFERKGFVYRTGSDIYVSDFYHEFYSPPGVLLRQAVGEWLVDSGIFTAVIGATDAVSSDWLLEGRVAKLYADLRDPEAPRAVLEAEFTLIDAESIQLDVVFKKGYGVVEEADGSQPAALVEAWNGGLARLLTAFEADLRAVVSARPTAAAAAARP